MPQYGLLAMIFSVGFFGYVMHATDWLNAIPGNLFDARFNSVILEHLYQWLRGEAPSLWSPAFFYPFENVLAFSDNLFGSGGVYALFRFAGQHREEAYLGWFVVGNLLNFWVTYYVFRKLGFSVVAAGAGAFVFAFGLPALLKEAHAQLIYRFAIPLCFLAMYQSLQTRRPSRLAPMLFWLAVQFYCSIYLGMFLIYLLVAMTFASVLCQGTLLFSGWRVREGFQSGFRRMASAGVALASVAAIGLLLYQYQSVSGANGFTRATSEIQMMLPTPGSYLLADRSELSSWVGASVPTFSMRHEHQMFFGLGLWLVALIGVWQSVRGLSHRDSGRIALLTLLTLVLFTLSVNGRSIYLLFLYLPGISSVRAVSRVVLVLLLPLAILAAIGIDSVVNSRLRRAFKWSWMVILLLLLMLETVYYRPYTTQISVWRARQLSLRSLLPASVSQDSILFATGKPGDYQDGIVELDAMILAQDMHLPTLNGYSGNFPKGHLDPYPCVSYKNRINSFFEMNPRSVLDPEVIARRVQQLASYWCPVTPAIRTDLAIDAVTASALKIDVTAQVNPHNLYVTVSITNTREQVFSTLSRKGPIRLSWRFVPLNLAGQPVSMPDWVPRKDLYFALSKGQTDIEILELDLPARAGRYQFEMTLVQDGVAWFQDLGMQTARQLIDVP